jgi:hypothetical protein
VLLLLQNQDTPPAQPRRLCHQYQVKLDASLLAKFGIHIADPTLHSIGIMLRGQWLNARGESGELEPARFVNVVIKGSDALKAVDEPALKVAA